MLAENNRPLHAIFEFPNVARPLVRMKKPPHVVRHALNLFLIHLVVMLDEILREQQRVVLPLAQGRQVHRHDGQPIIQVIAERLLFNHFLQRLIRGSDNPNIGFQRFRAAHALKFPLLNHAQNFGLRPQAHVADFIEKNRAVVRQLEPPFALFDRAGERPALVAEEFAFQQFFGQRRAIHLDERLRGAAAEVVNGIRHHLFARAAFPRN